MIYDRMYVQNDILGAALQAASVRNDVISNNIANNDVPRYKAKTVDFEESLIKALDDKKRTGTLDLTKAEPTIRYTHENFSYRIDENNVDIELEMVNLYQNSVKYDTMINGIINNSKRLNLAISGR